MRDRVLAGLVGRTVVVPVGDSVVRGTLVEVYRHWLVLDDMSSEQGSLDGRMVVGLPVAWVQVVDQ